MAQNLRQLVGSELARSTGPVAELRQTSCHVGAPLGLDLGDGSTPSPPNCMLMPTATLKARHICLSSAHVVGDSLLTKVLVRIPWLGPRVIYRLQLGGRGYPVQDWPGIARQVVRYRPDVLSVDVFDTCVVRDLVGDRAIEDVIDHRAADSAADRSAEAAIMEELLCRPVPGAAEALDRVREAEVDIVFLSDTDRSSELLTTILAKHGIFKDGDRLIASCEAGATKSDGTLFPQTWPSPSEGRVIWHAGNHLWADVAMAAVAGVAPLPFVEADGNRFENSMAVKPDGYGPAVAGAARLARLELEAERRAGTLVDHRADIQILGADVAGQSMVAFVLWVAERCRTEHIDHLGFLARDGELPLKLAEAIPADHWDGRSLHYLHCSRLTWSLAAASVLGVDEWVGEGAAHDGAFLHIKRHQVPLGALLARIGMTGEDLADGSEHRQLAGLDLEAALPEAAVEDWDALLADPTVRERISERADERLGLIVDRLRADAMPSGRYGLVDVGWRGRLASHVSAVLSQVVGEEPVHLHFGGDKVIAEVDARIEIKRFAFDGLSQPYPIEAPVSCVETLTASGKPRVIDYRRNADGSVELVFDDREVATPGDREELWAGALRMAANIPTRAVLDSWGLVNRSLGEEAKAVLDHWWNHPTEAEVRAFQGLTFEHDEAGTTFRPLVAPYRAAELRPSTAPADRQWPQGSAVISTGPMAAVARSTWTGRRLKRRFGR